MSGQLTSTAVATDVELPSPASGQAARATRTLTSFGVVGTFAVCFALFAVLKSSAFLSGGNMADISNTAAVNALIAAGVTVPLIMGDFDLSIGSAASLGSALMIVLTASDGWPVWGALLFVLGVAVSIGLVNGVVVARLKASSFIATLAMASVLTGIEYLLTDQRTIVENVPAGFTDFGGVAVGGLIYPVFLVVALLAVIGTLLSQTALGRQIQAIGSNADAARIVGLRVTRIRTIGFVVSSLCAVTAGLMIAAVAGNSFPDAGQSHLLPAFAAAFLGGTLFPSRRFSAVGAGIAAWLLEMIATGLVQLNLDSWTINVFNGVVLLAAILTAQRTVSRR
jgi:ribose transport system permease protein